MQKVIVMFCVPALAALIGIGVGAQLYLNGPQTGGDVNTIGRGEFENLQSQLKAVRNELARLQDELAARQARSTANRTGSKRALSAYGGGFAERLGDPAVSLAEADEKEASTILEARQQTGESNHYAQQMSAQYGAELRDEQWAQRQERAILDIVDHTRAFQDFAVSEIECRSDTCRVVVDTTALSEPHAELLLVGKIGRALPHATWEKDGDKLTLLLSRNRIDDSM